MHGKNICDALSNLPSNAITEAIRSGDFIFSGSRNVVLDKQRRGRPRLSQGRSRRAGGRSSASLTASFSTPSSPPSPSPRLMASTAHTTSTCSRGTARMRPPRGRWAPDHVKLVLSRAVLIVPCRVVCRMLPHVTRPSSPPHRLPVTGAVCACPPCIALQWGDCEMVAVFGKVKKQKAPRAAGETAELRQMESLEVWAASLKARQLAAAGRDRSRGSTDWRCSRGRRTRWPRTRSSTPTPSAWAISWSRRSGSGSSNASARASASLLHAARGRDAHHREPHGAAGGPALLARPGRPCGPPAEERARSSIKYYIGQQTHYSLEACCSDTSLIELLWR